MDHDQQSLVNGYQNDKNGTLPRCCLLTLDLKKINHLCYSGHCNCLLVIDVDSCFCYVCQSIVSIQSSVSFIK